MSSDICEHCGCHDIDVVGCALACRECGFQVEEAALQHAPDFDARSIVRYEDSVVGNCPSAEAQYLEHAPADTVCRPAEAQMPAAVPADSCFVQHDSIVPADPRNVSPTLKALALQAAACARDMQLPDAVALACAQAAQSHLHNCTAAFGRAAPALASAVLLCVAARIASYPLSLRQACTHQQVPLAPAQRLFMQAITRSQQPLPAVPVRTKLSAVMHS
jgi:hypothetical protein